MKTPSQFSSKLTTIIVADADVARHNKSADAAAAKNQDFIVPPNHKSISILHKRGPRAGESRFSNRLPGFRMGVRFRLRPLTFLSNNEARHEASARGSA
jgi:hypothetical protein